MGFVHSRRRAPRGQALTEMVLGLLVFITILLFGIHFAEVGYLSVKVTEASHSAMLDATGHKLHSWPKNAGPSKGAAQLAGQEANQRYADFDSRTSTNRGNQVTRVFTRIRGMNVSCQTGNGPSFNPGLFTILAYSDNDGMSCQAEATIDPIGSYVFPKSFMEGSGGFFSVKHYDPKPMRICGMGRAQGGSCPGRMTMMLDDWGLSGGSESGICAIIPDIPSPCLPNVPFYTMAASVFALNGLGQGMAGSQMASTIVGRMPLPFFYGGENMFWMSSAGEPLFVQPLPFNEGWKLWPTTPGVVPGGLGGIPYTVAYFQRDNCFLGRNCP
jgi:hypothetical protein